MKVFYLSFFLLIVQTISSQTYESLDSLYEVLNRVEKSDKLKKNEITLLLESYKEANLKNNAEFSEWRSEAVITIMYNIENLNTFLSVLNDNKTYQSIVMEELLAPVHEFDNKKMIDNLGKIKKYRKLRKLLISQLQ